MLLVLMLVLVVFVNYSNDNDVNNEDGFDVGIGGVC